MTYNIHPIIVHFPIALLFLYSIIKILPLSKWFPQVFWKHIERALLSLGSLGAVAALLTGGIAEHLVQPNHQLVEVHSTFAVVSTIIFGVLLAGEIISIFKPNYFFIINSLFFKLLALVGLITITITGMLGGIMVYGLSSDPLAPMILKLLGINL